MNVGDEVAPNGVFMSSAGVKIQNIQRAKITKLFVDSESGNHGMEIKILKGFGTADSSDRNRILNMGYSHWHRNNNQKTFRNPDHFAAGSVLRVFRRPFVVIQKENSVEETSTTQATYKHGYTPPKMNDLLTILSLS
mgnify:CR=1 FL=1